MNRDETHRLLRQRSALTSQPYGEDVIDAWQVALEEWTFDQCNAALIRAAREDKRITIAHLTERLPHRSRYPDAPPQPEWQGPSEGGQRIAAAIREHLRHHHNGQTIDSCPLCSSSTEPEHEPEPEHEHDDRLPL